jgi:hypothetical protein
LKEEGVGNVRKIFQKTREQKEKVQTKTKTKEENKETKGLI